MTTTHVCSHDMKNFLQELPKCEHHLHLEGTLEADLLFKLAARNGIELPSTFPKDITALNATYAQFQNLQEFLDYYYIGLSVLRTEEDYFELAYAYFSRAHKENVRHAEVFFDLQVHTDRGVSTENVMNGFERAIKEAEANYDMSVKLIMCLVRHLPAAHGMTAIEAAKPYFQNGLISGLGMDSSETPFPPELFTECYAAVGAISPEILLTAHAGEEAGPELVTRTLDCLKTTRIDHGVNSAKDPAVLKHLADNEVFLTVCPVSNIKLQVHESISESPIPKFLEAGVPFSINSDDPAYFGAYILGNYIGVQESFNFGIDTWCTIAKNGIKYSICSDDRKSQLYAELDQVYGKYKSIL